MIGAYTFKRFDVGDAHDQWDTPPGHWCAWRGKEQLPTGIVDRLFVVLNCPVCNLYATLAHAISAQGLVTPSVVCPHPPCPMHLQPVTLEGWDLGERPSEHN